MLSPTEIIGSIAANTEQAISKSIPLVRARTVSVTFRGVFNASATLGAEVYVYYSPDGNNYDSQSYGTLIVTVSAGNTVQATASVIVPEHGHIKFGVKNLDTSYTLTNVKVWYSIQAWPSEEGQHHGDVGGGLGGN